MNVTYKQSNWKTFRSVARNVNSKPWLKRKNTITIIEEPVILKIKGEFGTVKTFWHCIFCYVKEVWYTENKKVIMLSAGQENKSLKRRLLYWAEYTNKKISYWVKAIQRGFSWKSVCDKAKCFKLGKWKKVISIFIVCCFSAHCLMYLSTN